MDVDEVGSVGGNGSGSTSRTGLEATGHEIGVSNHVVKVIEVLAESARSWEDAARVALREATRSLRNITSIYVKDMQAIVRDGHVAAWRVNAKVSFIVSDQSHSIDTTAEGNNMGYRNQNPDREGNYRPWREGNAFPEYEEYGLHGDDRRQYRGRESYEQQSRGGQGGRSGMWPQRNVPRELDAPYRNHADEDRRGYQNLGSRSEFVSGDRNRPDYGRYGQANDRDYDEARYGFDARDYGNRDYGNRDYAARDYGNRDYGNRDYAAREYGNRDYAAREYGNRDYGNRDYAAREYGGYDRGDANRATNDDYSRTDYGDYSDRYSRGAREYGPSQSRRRTGLGPKGYKRSDERVHEDVCDRLSHDWNLDASEVEVTVSNGEVTLAGTIGNREQKFRAEHLADSVSGVIEVHNQLRVKRELPVQGSQAAAPPQVGRSTANQNRSS